MLSNWSSLRVVHLGTLAIPLKTLIATEYVSLSEPSLRHNHHVHAKRLLPAGAGVALHQLGVLYAVTANN